MLRITARLQTKPEYEGKTALTVNSDLAITIAVTSGEESLGLLVGEGSGSGREVLQEQPDVDKTVQF